MERPDEAGAGERDGPTSLPPRPPAEAAAYLHHLSSLAGHSFPSTSELLTAVLKTVVDSLGLRTSYLTHITCEDGRSEVLAAYNAPGGCDVAPGTVLVLTDTFWSTIAGSVELLPLLIDDTRADPAFSVSPAARAFPNIGSYLGVPLLLTDGSFFGTLCAVDPAPRTLTPQQAALLVVLARLLATQIERDREFAQREQLTAALQQARDELEARVQARTTDLAATNARLRQELAERVRAEAALQASEERFRALVQHAADVITVVDAAGTIRYVSPAMTAVLGYQPEELVGTDGLALVHPDEVAAMQRLLADLGHCPGRVVTTEVRMRHADGSWRWLDATATSLLDEPSVGGIVVNAHDITARKGFEEQLVHQAFHDPLTGLPNRALFVDRLTHALAREVRQHAALAVLFLDLDDFKLINDSLSHDVGDRLLIAVARRLEAHLRPGDTIARLGGDEFTILLEDIPAVSQAVQVAQRLLHALQTPFVLNGHEVVISSSIGIVRSTPGQTSAGDLLRDGDIAMYRAKQAGKGRYAIFEASMTAAVLERLQLEADLRRALEQGEFRVYYQPRVALTTGRVVGLEALVRWAHPQRGLVAPATFIPIAEETGLIYPLGRWVLREACRQGRVWQEHAPSEPPLVISVNLSAREFQQPGLVGEVTAVLRETGLEPRRLQLEITESVVMEHADATVTTLQHLKDLGVGLAIDDFGTGYSSLSYLTRFPVDCLKIDRAFVAGLGQDREQTAIVQAVITLAHTLALELTAEGIERREQLHQLRALGCETGQGFYFAKPVPATAAEALVGHVYP